MRRLDVTLNSEETRAFERILKSRKVKNPRATQTTVIRELVSEEAARISKEERPK